MKLYTILVNNARRDFGMSIHTFFLYQVSQIKLYLSEVAGSIINSMRPILQTEILIYQSNANLDENTLSTILSAKTTHLLDPKIKPMSVMCIYGNETQFSTLAYHLLAKISFLKLKIVLNLKFSAK